jgi:hypothetical protein
MMNTEGEIVDITRSRSQIDIHGGDFDLLLLRHWKGIAN